MGHSIKTRLIGVALSAIVIAILIYEPMQIGFLAPPHSTEVGLILTAFFVIALLIMGYFLGRWLLLISLGLLVVGIAIIFLPDETGLALAIARDLDVDNRADASTYAIGFGVAGVAYFRMLPSDSFIPSPPQTPKKKSDVEELKRSIESETRYLNRLQGRLDRLRSKRATASPLEYTTLKNNIDLAESGVNSQWREVRDLQVDLKRKLKNRSKLQKLRRSVT